MCSPPCISQATSPTPFDFTVDTRPKTGGKCANTSCSMQKNKQSLAQKIPFPGNGDNPFEKKVPKRKVLDPYTDYLKKRVKEVWPNLRMGNRLFEEIKAKGYRGSSSTVKKFLHRVRVEGEFPKETSLAYYKDYLKERLEKAQTNCISTRKLFNEITAKGYRGSFSVLDKFLWAARKKTKGSKEASIQFHKKYLIKRIKETYPEYASGTQLFQEIRAKGYRGSVGTLYGFLSILRKQEKKPSEVSLHFHRGYLIKRIKETYPKCIPGIRLFEEIRAKGYRGSLTTLQGFLAALRKQEKMLREGLSNASVEFHRDYLAKRLEETYPSFVSGTQLFKEIKAKGYRGSLSTFRVFLSTLRTQEKKPSEACVEFHEEYLRKRLKDTYPEYASGKELFKEIRAKGYRGSLTTFRIFLSTLRTQEKRPSEACVEFHEEYLSKRLKDTYPKYASGKELFEEIRAKGYQGSCSTLQAFLSTLREKEESSKKESFKKLEKSHPDHRNVLPEGSLQFHKEYLLKILQETRPSRLSPKQLFEEIVSRGYRGTCKEVEVFLMMVSK